MRNLRVTVFHMKTNVLQNFHICISVPLKSLIPNAAWFYVLEAVARRCSV